MAALFRNKAKSEGLIPFANAHHQKAGIFTDTFKLWCVKLKDLRVEDFARGTIEMEKRAEEIYKSGDDKGHREMWPPSFAEFRGMCFPSSDFDRQAHRMAPSLWDPVAMCYRLEDQTEKAKRYELGQKKSGELLELLGDTKTRLTPAQTAEAQEFARVRLEQAKQLLAKKQGA
jgi:hypothetical protein